MDDLMDDNPFDLDSLGDVLVLDAMGVLDDDEKCRCWCGCARDRSDGKDDCAPCRAGRHRDPSAEP